MAQVQLEQVERASVRADKPPDEDRRHLRLVPCPRDAPQAKLLRILREVLFVAFLFGAYNLGRYLSMGHADEAFVHAHTLIHLQTQLGLPSEAGLQRVALPIPDLAQGANRYYEFVHFPLTALVLLWLMIRRPAHYPKARWALAALTGLALVGHLVFPLAPPRMMPGWVDTGALLGQSVYGPDAQSGLANQFAAMPSLHVGWSLMVAVFMIRATRSRWRWLWIAHPVLTFTVVVVTANHYFSDGLVAIALAVPLLILFRPKQFRRRGRVRRDSAPALLGTSDQESAGVVAVASSSSARTR
ncbi:PAP2 superfamily protein [Kribbella voronezhensis]|uniref:PAP2 superfamily protein n=1 Tax=Kribbella voronezhensis TaxID=2512212 RepID=A0A4R7T6D7_9ACTN|nr:phosphatase PAP2 family protein [Kribbella voronezhensis]TDU87371.1 PAP2 superfamily protein [Kribbella voronezhensis]